MYPAFIQYVKSHPYFVFNDYVILGAFCYYLHFCCFTQIAIPLKRVKII